MKGWLSGDERTLAAFLGLGLLTMAFFRLDTVRDHLGVGSPLPFLLVMTAVAWWSFLPRSFVWLDPADLTWRDFGGADRATRIARRMTGGWLARVLALGYLLALLAAIVAAPVPWVLAGVALLAGAAVLAGAVARRPRTPHAETAVPLALAAAAVVTSPGPAVLYVLAAAMAVAGLLQHRPGPPPTRQALVDGWRDRVLRVSGVHFLDLALMLPAARPVRPRPVTSGLRLAWLGVLGRARHAPTAVLLALAAVAARRAFPALPDVIVFTVLCYLAVVPLTAGLGELWRSPGRRRWVGWSDTALRTQHLVVACLLAAAWGVPVWLLGGWHAGVLVTLPVVAACAVRTMTRKPPTYDNLVPVDTPYGALPLRLVLQTTRGPDAGLLALPLVHALPLWGAAVVAAAAVALAVFR
jgi:hypothetical protein